MRLKVLNMYSSTNDIFDRFQGASNKICFENSEYTLQTVPLKGNVKKHIYRCEQEQHNLIISIMGNVVVNVEGIYSIDTVLL